MHPEVVRETRGWLRYAREDLETARVLVDSATAPPRHAAWLAQQAAEKAIKAVFVALRIPFPFVHDLDRLVALVPDGWRVHDIEGDLSLLTDFAVDARYPDDLPDVDRSTARTGVAHARRVLEAVEVDLLPRLDASDSGADPRAGGGPTRS